MAKLKEEKINLSIIVTAHKEGILAHKTMLSILGSAKLLEEEKISYEILVHLDNCDDATRDYFSKYKDDEQITIFENTFGDLSESRNFTIGKARGEYVAITDADDLYSESWLLKFYKAVDGTKDTVARFSHVVTFGGERTIITDNSAMSQDDEFLYLFDSTTYGSPCMFHKSIFEEFPQRKNERPFGFEDWQWILDTKASGIIHTVVPETVLFYRKDPLAKESLLSGQVMYRATLSKSPFFEFDRLKKKLESFSVDNDPENNKPSRAKEYLKYRAYHTLVYLNSFSVYRAIKKRIKGSKNDGGAVTIPEWLITEWKKINKIEKTTYPDDYVLDDAILFIPNINVGKDYLRILSKLTKKPDTLYFVPWIRAGGADKVFINTANEIAKNNPSWNLAIMQTLSSQSDKEWIEKISDKINFLNLNQHLKNLDYEKQMQFMAFFIVQNDIKRIVIANSKFAYDFSMRYRDLIKYLGIRIYVFAFASSTNSTGRTGGFVHEDLPYIHDLVYKAITDNTRIIDEIHEDNHIDKNIFVLHRQYVDGEIKKPKKNPAEKKLKILWASRVHPEKMLEVLGEIGQRIGKDVDIDVYGKIEQGVGEDFFINNNLNYIRPFNGIDDVPTDNYDVFLYTSRSDGMPNILLEIASKGLPIIAPNVGGIGDFIKDNETGLMIDDNDDVTAYIDAIERLRDSSLRYRLASAAQELLEREYSQSNWERQVKRIFDK